MEKRLESAAHLAMDIFSENPTRSESKNIYNNLNKLKKQKLVTSVRPEGFRAALYFLTPKGFEFAKQWLDILDEQSGEGWLGGETPSYGDFNYEIYSPPLTQVAHHVNLIEFFLQFFFLGEKPFLIDSFDSFDVDEKLKNAY